MAQLYKLTMVQFLNQNENWTDQNYAYAIHITDGGAVYLYRMSLYEYLNTKLSEEIAVEVIRLDGVDLKEASKHIKQVLKRA